MSRLRSFPAPRLSVAARISVAFGSEGAERQLTHVAAGTAATDAVNVSQLQSIATALGAGSVLDNGVLVGGTYVVQGTRYASVGAAMTALDQALDRMDTGGASSGTVAVGGSGGDAQIGAGTNAVAIGSNAIANGENGLAVGTSALACGPNDTALGANARVNADGNTAVGANTSIAATATNAVAVGERASVSAASGTAIGQGAAVSADNAVALGRNAVANRANTVSVAGAERQVVNVAAGTAATDAVNLQQLQAADAASVATANAYTDNRIDSWDTTLTALRNETDRRFHSLDQRIDRMGAISGAYAGMAMNTAGPSGANRVGVGVGSQGGESALAVGYQRAFGNRASVSIGGAFAGNETSL
ncbi:YadA family autotransporter adhesin [Xanthomonas populi]|uniref:YadA family autotransporter adhesin n=1 Tax=Xanthomonas populi TaxID=53414 RepID=UPI001FC91CB7|nr:YadA-like family protein [Xanthomonas populi]